MALRFMASMDSFCSISFLLSLTTVMTSRRTYALSAGLTLAVIGKRLVMSNFS